MEEGLQANACELSILRSVALEREREEERERESRGPKERRQMVRDETLCAR